MNQKELMYSAAVAAAVWYILTKLDKQSMIDGKGGLVTVTRTET